MNKKAQQLHQFITAHGLENAFSISEHTGLGRNFVIFDTSVQVALQRLKLAVIIEEGLQTIIRVWLGHRLIDAKNKYRVFPCINQLNTDYKGFKFFFDKNCHLIMDWINSTPDELFDPSLIHFTLGVINREIEYIHPYLMEAVSVS